MNDESSLLLQRRELYGPNRCMEREVAKQLQKTDHIQMNFERGSENMPSKQSFQSTTARTFIYSESVKDFSKIDTHRKYQTGTHIHFDGTPHPSTSMTQTDFIEKPVSQFKRHFPDGLDQTNLADMAPQYMVDKTFGVSQYKSHFDGNKAYEAVERKGIRYRKDCMRFNKSTHFKLGDHLDSPVSMTSFTYRGIGNPTKDSCSSNLIELRQPKSYVFREGDYNLTSLDPRDHFTSTHKKAFCKHLAAGMSMQKSSCFHILPRCPVKDPVSTLRKILIEKNEEEFKNPRDPTGLNVVKAFSTYDQTKCGSISVTDINAMTKTFGISLNEGDISNMLEECGCEEGKLDFFLFCEYLTARTEPQKNLGDFVSTSMATYRAGPQKNDEDSYVAEFPTLAHFQLGTDVSPTCSVYAHDFDSSQVKGMKKIDSAPCPSNSKVMPEYPRIPGDISTNRSDYISHDVTYPGVNRTDDLREFKEKQERLAIELGSEIGDDLSQRRSIAMSSYSLPQCTGFEKPIKPVWKDFHYLESNRALPYPLLNYTASEPLQKDYAQKLAKSIDDRTAKSKHNKGTHFQLRSDNNPKKSESMVQFLGKQFKGPSAPTAGKISLPIKGYSLTTHDSGEGIGVQLLDSGPENLQQLLQQRNYLKNINPRDTINLNLRKSFLEYNTDLSGSISKDQLKAICKNMRVNVNNADIDHIIAKCDTKGDGLIDYNEFAFNLSRAQPPGTAVLQASVTGQDFVHPQKQQMSEGYRLMLTKDSKRFTQEIRPSHYFHMSKDCIKSITKKDFIAPEDRLLI